MINRETFLSRLKPTLFKRQLGIKQREGITTILDRWDASKDTKNPRHLAYLLATVHHETAQTMQPIREKGGTLYLRTLYDVTGNRPALARANGNTTAGDGVRYAGRGFVQLTWKNNYKRAGDHLGLDLVTNPDLALGLAVATDILFAGMNEGWFTGKKLSNYLNGGKTDWINARRIINGLDKADLIAELAKAYLLVIGHATMTDHAETTAVSKGKAIKSPKVKPSTILQPRPRPAQPVKQSR